MIIRGMRSGIGVLISTAGIKIASLIKISYIVGSYTAFFSCTCIAMPLVGAFSGITGSIATCLLGLILGGGYSLTFLAHHIPGFCASLYWATGHALIRVGIPSICFILFVTHPIGSQAWPYALYWLIPIALYCVNRTTLFMQALGSTFVAHAVGSVIWLYAVPMQPQAWLALMPVVALERLTFAAGMVVAHTVMTGLGVRGAQIVGNVRRLMEQKA
jgi:hypothetical protein